MKKLHNTTAKLPRLGELPGWRNLITETRISIQPNIIAPFTVRSKRDLNLSPRYPKQVKLPPIPNPQTSREFSRESLKPTRISYKPLDLKPSVSKILKIQQTLHAPRRSLSSSLVSNTIYSRPSQDNSLEKTYSRNSLSLDPDQEIKRILSKNSNQLKRSKNLLQEAGSVITSHKNDRVKFEQKDMLKEIDDSDSEIKRNPQDAVGFEDTMRVMSEGHSGTMSIENMNFDLLRNVERSHEESRYSDYPLVYMRKLQDSLMPVFQLNTQNTLPEKIYNKFHYLEEKPVNDEEDSMGNRSYEYIKTHSMSYRIHNSDESLSESSDIYVESSSSKISKKSLCRQSFLNLILDSTDNEFEVKKLKNVNGINCVKTKDKVSKMLSIKEYIENNDNEARIELKIDDSESEEHEPKTFLFWYPIIFILIINVIYLIFLRNTQPTTIHDKTKNSLAINFPLHSKTIKPLVKTSPKINLNSPKKPLKSPKSSSKSPGIISKSPQHVSKSPEASSTLPKAPGFPKTLNAKKSPRTLIQKPHKTLKNTSPPTELKPLNVKSPKTGNKSPIPQKKIKKSTRPAATKPNPPILQAATDINITITLNNQPITQEISVQSNLSVFTKPSPDPITSQPVPLPMQPPASSLLKKSSLGLITPNYNYFRKLYGIHKSPITSFINNFSRSLMFTIQQVAELEIDSKTSLISEDSLEQVKKQREKRIQLESVLSEDTNSKDIIKRNQSLENRFVEDNAILLNVPRRSSLPRKGKKNETSPEASNISSTEPKISIKIKSPQKSYVKKTVYPLLTSTMQSYSIVNRNKFNESSESLPFDSDSYEEPELSDSDSNSLDLKSHLKYDYIRASAVYEAGLLRTLANSIVIGKNSLSVIDESLNNHTEFSGKQTNEPLKSSDSGINASNEGFISKNDLDFLIEPRIERLLFFRNEETKFASKVVQEDNEKFIIESQLDHENLKRNEMKKRFLKNPYKGGQDETESLSFLHVLPIEQLITERLEPKLNKNKFSSQKFRLKL